MINVEHMSATCLHYVQSSKGMLSMLRSKVVAGMGPSAAHWVLRSSWATSSWIIMLSYTLVIYTISIRIYLPPFSQGRTREME